MKAERSRLLGSLAKLKKDTQKAGSELQQQDIAHLRRDVELKQQRLNELKQVPHARCCCSCCSRHLPQHPPSHMTIDRCMCHDWSGRG